MIDAHQHYWRIGRNGQEWPTPDLAAVYRDFLPADWKQVAEPIGITGSIAVQSQPNDADTDWLLQLADRTPSVLAVVGWAELKDPGAPRRIEHLARNPKLKGLRPMLQNLPDRWIAEPLLDPAIETMIAHALRFNALVYTRHLSALHDFACRWPDLQIVIDHGAKPPISEDSLEPWRSEMRRLAALPNVMCKLSGLFTEMAPAQPRKAAEPFIRSLCNLFGPERLMWGSDWPVLVLAGDYGEWFETARRLSGFDEAGQAKLFGGTAARFYGLAQS